MKKRLRKLMIIIITTCLIVAAGVFLFLKQAKFGRNPEGGRLTRISLSANYRDGEFKNIVERPMMVNKDGALMAMIKYLLTKKERSAPDQPLPSRKVDLKTIAKNKDILVWLGHSSYYFQLSGRTILVDPVFSEYAAPISFVNKAFAGSTPYQADDFPDIDYLLITHDHWDHLDYPTVMALKPRVKNIVAPLGVGSHFLRWGFPVESVTEADWNEALEREGLSLHILPAQHFSGRLLDRNKTLWAAFALKTGRRKIFISGDTGYGPHFKKIGRACGGFDLALLDSGQYDPQWPYLHMTPEEAVTAAQDLRAKALLPSHIGKFSIANHSWDDPFIRADRATSSMPSSSSLWTPIIGRPIDLDQPDQVFDKWWESLNQ